MTAATHPPEEPATSEPDAPAHVTVMPVAVLRDQPSVRVNGVNEDHVLVLAELPGGLPPIVVHRTSLRVIDGMHRVRAARLRGDQHISAVLVDGDDAEALVLAVRLNTRHGLPLSRRDRRAAVERLLDARPEWSDRRIAAVVGVSHKTVGAVRRRSTGETAQTNTSVGRDGRARPRDASVGRAHAAALLEQQPDASTREIARRVGLSPSTVLDVRRRRAAGLDAVRASRSAGSAAPAGPAELARCLAALRGDPALRYSLAGRTLLRLLSAMGDVEAPDVVASAVPAHVRSLVAELARDSADRWMRVALRLDDLDRQGAGST